MKSLSAFIFLFWLSVIGGGVVYLTHYQFTPGNDAASEAKNFPRNSRLELDSEHPTLILFAHPKCPCTRASLRELDRLMARTSEKLKAYVVFVKPPGASDDWTQTDSREIAEAIPGVEIVTDENEREADLFEADTSGIALLYDTDGTLRFHGGITNSRGMEGDSSGAEIITQIANGETPKTDSAPVFGCALRNK